MAYLLKEPVHMVYKTTCLVNGRFYIGYYKTSYLGSGIILKLAVAKYSEENFKREILFIFDNFKEAYDKEEEEIVELYRKIDPLCMNIRRGGIGSEGGIQSEETRAKISAALKGRKLSEEHKKKLLGRNLSKEGREKIGDAHRGKIVLEEARQKISKARAKQIFSIESNEKRRKSCTGMKLSDEAKRKISLANKGRIVSLETRKKMSETLKGRNTRA